MPMDTQDREKTRGSASGRTSWPVARIPSVHVNDLGLGAAPDDAIEAKAREMGAVIWSKDADFAERARRLHGLQVVWLRVGNTTNASLQAGLRLSLPP